MFVRLNAVIVDADASNRLEMAGFLTRAGVNVVSQLPSLDVLPPILSRPDPPVLIIVNLDPTPADTLRRVGGLVRQFNGMSFFVMSQVMDPQLLMDAMHLGVREFVPLPIVPEKFAAGIERVAQLHGMGKRARIVSLIPTIGGCGATTLACNIAASLARNAKTVLIDLDLVRGSVAASFDLRPRYTIADIMDSGDRLDNQLLDNALAVHKESNLAILARPELPEDSLRVTQAGFSRLISILGRLYDYVVIDSLMSIDPLYSAALHCADIVLPVVQLNVPSVKNAERFLGAMRRMGTEAHKLRLVVNRYVRKGWEVAPEEVERLLALKINWLIPNDFKNAMAAINFGEPVVLRAPKSEMSMSLVGLAQALVPGKAQGQAA